MLGRKCRQLNILPIAQRFDMQDLTFFHSIFYGYSVVKLPPYITLYTGTSRLRSSHLDNLSLISDITPKVTQTHTLSDSRHGITKSYFYRAHLAWNRLPFDLRQIRSPGLFKTTLIKHLWSDLVSQIREDDDPDAD